MDIHNKRLKHERGINKYTSNLQEKNTTTNFITIVIYFIIKNLQINLILKARSPQRESLREDDQIFSKVLKVGCVHGLSSAASTSCPRNPYYVQSFPFFIFSGSSFYAQNLCCKGMMLQLLLHLKSWRNWRRIGKCLIYGSKGTNESSLKWTNQEIVEKDLVS